MKRWIRKAWEDDDVRGFLGAVWIALLILALLNMEHWAPTF